VHPRSLFGEIHGSVEMAPATLVNVTRWVSARQENLSVCGTEANLDIQCFELRQKIHRYASQTRCAEPMQFSKDPAYDSVRHRFQKLFGISPRGLLVRIRMERAKELLRTSNISVKQIAQELGYSKQHEFTRAFHRFSGMSPKEWRCKADVPRSASNFSPRGSCCNYAIDSQNVEAPGSKVGSQRLIQSPQDAQILPAA
jgi:hypothetical protein